MSQTRTIVKMQYAAFDTLADDVIDFFIDKASVEIGRAASIWGNFYPYAVAALAAHFLEIRARSLAAASDDGTTGAGAVDGAPLSVSTDRLSISYANTAASVAGKSGSQADAIYAATAGGKEYLRLRGRIARIAITT